MERFKDTYTKFMQVMGCGIQNLESRTRCGHNCCDGENCVMWLNDAFMDYQKYIDTGLSPAQVAELAEAEREGRLVVLKDYEVFTRCEDCIHGGWTDDVTAHCNFWHTEDDLRCVGYLGFCGAGVEGEMLEIAEARAEAEAASRIKAKAEAIWKGGTKDE